MGFIHQKYDFEAHKKAPPFEAALSQYFTQIIPTAQHILESYSFLSLEEKNRLWKLVLKKVTIYRSPDDEITIRLHPNLPK